MDLDKLEATAKLGLMGTYSALFVELIALIRKQEAASQPAQPADTVDSPDFEELMVEWFNALGGKHEVFWKRKAIAHIDAHVAAQVAKERLRADNADGMAECMRMFRDDMISAGIIDAGVAPMFMSKAIMRVVAAKDAEIKTLKAALDAQGELTDRYQEIALSAQAAAPVAYLRFRAAQQWSGVGGSDIEYAEWYETCQAHEIGDDKRPAFPVYVVRQPSPAPVAMTDEKERKLFEQSERESELSMDSDGDYANPCVQSAWEGWKARAILAAKQEAV